MKTSSRTPIAVSAHFDRPYLLVAAPALFVGGSPEIFGVADDIGGGEVNKGDVGFAATDGVGGLIGDDVVIVEQPLRRDEAPIDRAGPGQRVELGFAGEEGSGKSVGMGDFKKGGDVRIDDGAFVGIVPGDAVDFGRHAGQHAGVRGESDGKGGGVPPEGKGALAHEVADIGGARAGARRAGSRRWRRSGRGGRGGDWRWGFREACGSRR